MRMKAVMPNVPEHILEWRRRTGADRYDEMWEGVLHMAPVPNRDHQDFAFLLAIWLRSNWAIPNGCRVHLEINIAEGGTWPDNYRVPDLVLLTPTRFHIDRNEYFDGGPDAVVEIHSPGDEAYEKLEFYAKIGVREVWIIDRDTRQPQIYRLVADEFEPREPDSAGWLQSDVVGAEMRATADEKLEIRIMGRHDTRENLP
jgi:Uma2 family endonuclease